MPPPEEKPAEEWMKKTSCHGWTDFLESDGVAERIFWIAMIAGSVCFVSVHLALLFSSFNDEETWSTHIFKQNRQSLPIPQITICNFNRINQTRAINDWNMSSDLIEFVSGQFRAGHFLQAPNETMLKKYEDWRTAHWAPNFLTLIDNLGHDCQETLLYGEYRNGTISCTKHATSYMDREFGKCILLNPNGELGSVSVAGVFQSVNLILGVGLRHYQSTIPNAFLDSGLVIKLSYDPFVTTWTAVPPGFHAWIDIKRREMKLPAGAAKSMFAITHPNCIAQHAYRVFPANTTYSRLACLNDCLLDAVWQKCNCSLNSIFLSPICEPADIQKCLDQFDQALPTDLMSVNCTSGCKSACNEVAVDATASLSQFPNPASLEDLHQNLRFFMEQNWTKAELRAGAVSVDIFFSSLDVLMIEWYEKMTVDQLFSSIGGQFGLCAGISLLTIVQAFWFCGISCCRLFRKTKVTDTS